MSRLQKVRAQLEQNGLDVLLISQSENRRYLSKFTGSDGWLLISQKQALVLVDFRYTEQAKQESPDFDAVQIKGDISTWLPQLALDYRYIAIGFEADALSVSTYDKLKDTVKNKYNDLRLIPTYNLVESIRATKDADEISCIKRACKIVDDTFEYAKTIVHSGMKEIELAWEIEKHLREAGSEVIPFEIIVASGANAALPHARSSEQEILPDRPVVIDMGARVDGYCSDFTRTFCIGMENETFQKIYDTVLGAQLTAQSTIISGMRCEDADRTARAIIESAGYGAHFGHGLGHGVGLAVHELPRLGPLSNDILTEAMVFTIEPGIYISGWGGVRIEDTVIMENGKLKPLTTAEKVAIFR